jgi:5'-nucleotidase (lipoprotein e(P4) family)
MMTTSTVLACLSLLTAGCAGHAVLQAPDAPHAAANTGKTVGKRPDLSLYWVKHGAEYRALTRQIYNSAGRDLPGFVEDKAWSALPGQTGAANLPPAVILDVDETVVSNVDFQLGLEPPLANWKLDQWARDSIATPVDGVVGFIRRARELGVDTYFITNRPCEPREGSADPCPQRQTTIDDIGEIGIDTDAAHVLLSEERGWNREKLARREFVGRTHRILMVIGDDYSDFVPCAREQVVPPCTTPATLASRQAQLDEYGTYWGHGWYILPNPMHGSWTTVLETE